MREEYLQSELSEKSLLNDPVEQFKTWFEQARSAGVPEPNAMTLATCTPDGRPSARVVLLKSVDEAGFVFFTNYQSRKSVELEENPHATLLFSWLELQRQVRIEGICERISEAESTAYFQSRPRGNQIGAWASPQSRVIADREQLEQKMADLSRRFEGVDPLPKPPHWGGFRVIPYRIEFWQGRGSRLHDRLVYEPSITGKGQWAISRLAP